MKGDRRQGTLANSSGSTLENTVTATLSNKGFATVPYSEYKKYSDKHGETKAGEKYGTELLLKNYPYQSIYGHSGKSEFLLRSELYNLTVRIECKWQQVNGSVDEKYPYVYHNCLIVPEHDIIIILDGGGAKPGAIQWLRQKAESTTEKNIMVMSIMQFIRWANVTFG